MLKEQQMSAWGEHPYHIVPSLTQSSTSSTASPRQSQSFATTSLSLSLLPSAQRQGHTHSFHYPTQLTSSYVDCATSAFSGIDNNNNKSSSVTSPTNDNNKNENNNDVVCISREHKNNASEEISETRKEQHSLANTISYDNCRSFADQPSSYASYCNPVEFSESNNNNHNSNNSIVDDKANNTNSKNNSNDSEGEYNYFVNSNNQEEKVIAGRTNAQDEYRSGSNITNSRTLAMTENAMSDIATRTATANTRSYISVSETQYCEREELVHVAPELTYSHTLETVDAGLLRSPLSRPPAALSANIMTVYKNINLKFCNERRRQMPRGAHGKEIRNNGYDDEDGHYIPIIGEEIASRYTVQEVIGKGSFGVVLKCCDEKYQEGVAMKIVRTGAYFESQGMLEAEIVAYLNRNPALQNRVVQLRKAFIWQYHIVLVFELLSFNLFQLIRCTKYNGVSLDLTRKFAYQLLQVLLQLEMHRPPIIHCDLKPENVVLRDPSRSGIRLIDFGSACYQQMREWEPPPLYHHHSHQFTSNSSLNTFLHSNNTQSHLTFTAEMENSAQLHYYHHHSMPKYIQSRFYRAPEVILELGYTTAIDRWSLGCMLVELHTGVPLFPGKNEAEMLARFTAICGPIPHFMLERSPKVDRFYDKTFASAVNLPRPPPFHLSSSSSTTTTTSSSPLIPSPASMVHSNSHHSHRESANATEVDNHSSNSNNHNNNNNRGSNSDDRDGSSNNSHNNKMYSCMNMATEQNKMQAENDESASHLINTQIEQQQDRLQYQHVKNESNVLREEHNVNNVATFNRDKNYDSNSFMYALKDPPSSSMFSSLMDIIGVYDGGPRGCRRGQHGHDVNSYLIFADFISNLLQYDPRLRMDCATALRHPFFQPILEIEAREGNAMRTKREGNV